MTGGKKVKVGKKKVTGGKRVKYLLMATVGVQKFEALVFTQKRHRETGQTQIQTASEEAV